MFLNSWSTKKHPIKYAKNLPCLLPPCANRENLEGVVGVVILGGMPGLDCWPAGTFGKNGAPNGGGAAEVSWAPFIGEPEVKIAIMY